MFDNAEFVLAALLEEGLLDRATVDNARAHATANRVSIIEALIELGAISKRDVAITRASICECTFVDLDHYNIDIRNSRMLPRSVAERHAAFPLFDMGGVITVGMADALDLAAVDQIRGHIRSDLDPVMCEPDALRELIARAYSLTAESSLGDGPSALESSSLITGEEPIVAAVNQIITQAAQEGASDVHINPDEKELHLRFRLDGSLQLRHGPPRSSHQGIVQRLKVLANLDLTQTRRPQDGKFRFMHNGKPVDIRLSLVPTIHGENVVMRLLASGTTIRGLGELGITPAMAGELENLITHPHGIFLVTGPTGSGKTTTLYTALSKVNTPDRNVMTIEDPVEIRLPLVRQIQVNTEIGLTFASALRAMLRQDPDVILLGEIRDEETARIALQAALTGHLVLATLHTNDAPGVISRLRDLGCPPFAINAALLGALAQRLVKRVCAACTRPATPSEVILRRFRTQATAARWVEGAGCPGCMSTGYKGRLVVAELLPIRPNLQVLIERGAGTAEVRRHAHEYGMKPMWLDGMEKATLGLTTLDEVARVVVTDLELDAELEPPQDQLAAGHLLQVDPAQYRKSA